MSKVMQVMLFIIVFDVVMGFYGFPTSTGQISDFINGVKNTGAINGSQIFLAILSTMGIAAVAILAASIIFRPDMGIMLPATLFLIGFAAEINNIINTLNMVYVNLGYILGIPIAFMFIWYCIEWWRTPLS